MNHKIIRTALALLFLSLLVAAPRAQQSTPVAKSSAEDRVALYQALLDLTNPWTVMCIAAHPDDEDGTSLIVMRRKYGAHTVSLFSTFGEGGQNAIGPELYEELGAIRARETMAAAEIQGSEPYFLGLKDFGYSKSAEETFQKWGHDDALRRMVLQIRKLRPDIIITNHSVTNNDHGHHQATARLVLEAFDAAADPKRFDGFKPWQVQRLFVRIGRSNQSQAGTSPVVTIDPNERDPIRGVVYAEEALRALQKHATQGPWPRTFAEFAARFRLFTGQGAAPGQLPLIRYVLVREAKGAGPLPANSRYLLEGLELPKEVAKRLQPPVIDGKPLTDFIDQPDRVFDAISKALKNNSFAPKKFLEGFPDDNHLYLIDGRTDRALASASGIMARTIVTDPAVPGQAAMFELEVTNEGARPARLTNALFNGFTATIRHVRVPPTLEPGATVKLKLNDRTPPDVEITVPHFMHLYDGRFAGQPLSTNLFVEVAGTNFSVIDDFKTDIVPAVEIVDVNPSPLVLTPQTERNPKTFKVQALSHGEDRVRTSIEVIESVAGNNGADRFPIVRVPVTLSHGQKSEVTIKSEIGTKTFLTRTNMDMATGEATSIKPPDAHARHLIFRATNKLSNEVAVPAVYADARVSPNLHIGYIRGFDYSLPNALDALGVESKELRIDDVKTADLSKYISIIVDNRVYESQPELIAANQKLLDYAKDGGTLIVFYHKSNEWNPDERRNRPQLAPYKLILGDERVTDENAPVTFIEPQHPLLNSPNKIGPDDFKDWIQERGLYYPKEWDSQFHALLQSNDPGEAPLKGGLLVADYGRGHYIYSSMVWYRQLRAGEPGAYRMLANMISYGHAK